MDKKIIKAKPESRAIIEPTIDRKVVKSEVYGATLEAHNIIEEAQRKAQATIQEAQQRRDVVIESARQQGYQEGLSQWNQAVMSALQAHDKLLGDSEEQLLRLAVHIAEKIIGEQIRSHPETIVDIVREALKSVRQERSLTIQVNPEHLEIVRQRLARLEEIVGIGRQIQIVPNPSLGAGGCIVESELGVIDARLETQLKCLEEALLRVAKK